jgi:hypothetical protein
MNVTCEELPMPSDQMATMNSCGEAVYVTDQVVPGLLLFRLPLDLGNFPQEVSQFVAIQFGDWGNPVDISNQVFLSTLEGREMASRYDRIVNLAPTVL